MQKVSSLVRLSAFVIVLVYLIPIELCLANQTQKAEMNYSDEEFIENESECERCEKKNALDLQLFGFGPGVGAAALYFVHHYEEMRSLEVGAGLSNFGHVIVFNQVYSLIDEVGLASSIGASYTGGLPQEESTAKLGDGIWLHANFSIRHQASNGFRYIFELGMSVSVITEIFRKNGVFNSNEPVKQRYDYTKIEPFDAIINITLVRAGYAF